MHVLEMCLLYEAVGAVESRRRHETNKAWRTATRENIDVDVEAQTLVRVCISW